MKVSSTRQPIFLSKTLVQGSTLWIDSIWQWIPRIRSATFWSEARISQNTRLSRESDSHIYAVSIPPRSYKSLGWGSDNHVRMVKRRKPVYTAVWQRIMRIDDINGSMQVPVNLENDPDEPLSPFSPMMAPRLWSKLFLAIRGGCRFLFLSSTSVMSSELLFGRLVQLLSFFLWQ